MPFVILMENGWVGTNIKQKNKSHTRKNIVLFLLLSSFLIYLPLTWNHWKTMPSLIVPAETFTVNGTWRASNRTSNRNIWCEGYINFNYKQTLKKHFPSKVCKWYQLIFIYIFYSFNNLLIYNWPIIYIQTKSKHWSMLYGLSIKNALNDWHIEYG